ncbi:MAG: hypothetical protein JXB23_14685 [Candidatus Aminicenantes bacterium]|nr:hypothetical protein [Candidatus Aminicenantes bacterium]
MLAGILHDAGYFLGDKLYLPRDTNPKGFFEWREINRINELILSAYSGKKRFHDALLRTIFKKHTVRNPGKNQRWLLSLQPHIDITHADAETQKRIDGVIAREPFCYKDPRFSYTLPVWRRFLKPDTPLICIFREPNITVESILKECRSAEYLADLFIRRKNAFAVWANMYMHILFKNREASKNLHFVHYNQVYDRSALPSLSRILEVDLKGDFVDDDLKRSTSESAVPDYVSHIYERLCGLAGYKDI